ncbi:zinc finger MYM-type protein 1 [Artemisia annua]|uniref:Zinc finger MYM-type protein 1 n=1 Tax=Artemisia annua TaxID=35608 RepID=A0A2U1NYF9_ARTAN|nr:zinc finger MYM-type protein 1 [Artemisia annua]
MPPKTLRKQDSGSKKHLKKQRTEESNKRQYGSMHKFVQIEPQDASDNQDLIDDNVDGDNMNVDGISDDNVDDVELNDTNVDDTGGVHSGDVSVDSDDIDDTNIETNTESTRGDNGPDEINADNVNVDNPNANVPRVNIFDPRKWDGLSSDMIKALVEEGPKRDNSFYKGVAKGSLVNEGFSDWAHLSTRLKEHEVGLELITNMATWFDMRSRLKKNETIDTLVHEQFEKERDHWMKVLLRIISVVKFLAKHNLAFRGTNEKLHVDNNGNFLGLIEMLEEFDPIIKEHVRRITSDEIHVHYLGHTIQNELIQLLARGIRSQIIQKIKQAKYFSVILDCTPDTSHQEQMSLILRYVNVASTCVTVEESFLGFLNVDDTTGQGLFDVTHDELKSLDLDIDDVGGQGYDNGSNMKGKHRGVQKKFLDINPRAFYTPCGCHSLNLTLCDIASSCGKAMDFFGVIQRIYTMFANSSKRWKILKNNVKGLTLKSLSITRWESRVESVKAIRFQLLEIREALLQVAENDNDSKIKSESKSLATNELGDFEFLVSTVIWFDILSTVNLVSKKLQSDDMLIDVAIKEVEGLISFFEEFRETVFRQKRVIRRKRQCDENSVDQDTSYSVEESFKVEYFLYIVDRALVSLRTRFEQYKEYEKVFGFLFTSGKLNSFDDNTLKSHCAHLEVALKNNEQSDVDAKDLFVELRLLNKYLPKENLGPSDILNFLKEQNDFPNAMIAYRVLLTIPVTVASAERSFSKLKLLKSYLRSTMSQERLNGLALIAIENGLLESVDYEALINNFASKNARRSAFFGK